MRFTTLMDGSLSMGSTAASIMSGVIMGSSPCTMTTMSARCPVISSILSMASAVRVVQRTCVSAVITALSPAEAA